MLAKVKISFFFILDCTPVVRFLNIHSFYYTILYFRMESFVEIFQIKFIQKENFIFQVFVVENSSASFFNWAICSLTRCILGSSSNLKASMSFLFEDLTKGMVSFIDIFVRSEDQTSELQSHFEFIYRRQYI